MGNLLCSSGGEDGRRAERKQTYFERNGSFRKSDKSISHRDFLRLVETAEGGDQVYVCSYSRWVRSLYRITCFSVNADYVSARPSYQRLGTVARPDLQNGRNFQVEHFSRRFIRIREGRVSLRVEIPEIFSGISAERTELPSDFHHFTDLILEGSPFYYGVARMIGYRAGICVIHCCDPKKSCTQQILVVHLGSKACIAKIPVESDPSTQQNSRCNCNPPVDFKEAYISRDASQIFIRPDDTPKRTPQIQNVGPPLMTKQEETESGLEIFQAENFPGALAFDNRYPNRYLFQAYQDTLYLIDLKSDVDLEVVKWQQLVNLDADVVQVKSSHSGQYLALRCVSPTQVGEFRPCLMNFIYIIAADNFQTLFCCDARGPYWPISETINYQVFPCFSMCDTLVSFMRNTSSKRQVFVYKLPITKMSLQNSCRSVILRQLGSFHNIDSLNLPKQIKQFLNYKL